MSDLDPAAIAKALAEPFPVARLRWKPQVIMNDRALSFPYVSAADVMNKLDKVLGVDNWKDRYEVLASGCVVCRLSVRIAGEWLTKTDAGAPSEQDDPGDQLKASFSDSLKRAAVRFGVARYLHYLPPVWLPYNAARKQLDLSKPVDLPAWARPAA